ncbi:chloride channel protein [Halomicroarcula limicola]|uniref:Chloride channel protein n=1 Tax=Haloarcula limicola TaxID=1429915 RepID=A0A8J7Y8F5_9EURY|nr:chloride channel protein [Halomicroarcula limicola]MBV0926002.1 chloride channel protein [Halomicroarcula limicola]
MAKKRSQYLRPISPLVGNFSRVLFVAIGLAVLIGCLTGVFLRVLYWSTTLLWRIIPEAIAVLPGHPGYTLVVCTAGGVVLGLGREYLGDYPRGADELIAEIREGRRIHHGVISKEAVNSLVSLTFGASLGPELALATIGGGLSSQVKERLTAAVSATWTATAMGTSLSLRSVIFRSEQTLRRFGDGDVPPVPRWWKGIPTVAALACGLLMLKLAAGAGLHFGRSVPRIQSPLGWQLVITVLLGVAGGCISVCYLQFRYRLRNVGTTGNVLVRSTLGGVLLGLAGAVAPRILFSGQDVVGELFTGLPLAAWALVTAGFAKIVMVSVMLETGWKGGPILPLMAGGATLGAGLAEAVPAVGSVVGLTAMMASLPTAELTRPLVIAGSVALFFSPSLFLVATVGAVAGAVVVRFAETLPFADRAEPR